MALALPCRRNHPHRGVRHAGRVGGDVRCPSPWLVAACAGGGYGPPPFILVSTEPGAGGALRVFDVHGACDGDGDEPRLPSQVTIDWSRGVERLAIPCGSIQIRAALEPGCRRSFHRENRRGPLPDALGGCHGVWTSVSVPVTTWFREPLLRA